MTIFELEMQARQRELDSFFTKWGPWIRYMLASQSK